MKSVQYRFWSSDTFGLIRQKTNAQEFSFPEIWSNGFWIRGNAHVMDAVTGMGEDAYSCGEIAVEIGLDEAIELAAERNIDLFASPKEAGLTKPE